MNKKVKTLLSLGVITIVTGTSIFSINNLGSNSHTNNTNNSKVASKEKSTDKNNDTIEVADNANSSNPNLADTNVSTKPSISKSNSKSVESNNNSNTKTTTDNSNSNKNNDKTTNATESNNNSNITKNSNDNNIIKSNNNNDSNSSNQEEKISDNKKFASTNFSSFQQQVVSLVNSERSKQGLNPVSLNSSLSSVATLKSQDMINKGYFDHTSPTYGSPFDMMGQFGISYSTAGENIAMGQTSPSEVMNSWMNSSGHRANILNASFTEIGVGIAKSSDGSLYWTQMFIGN